VKIYITIAMAMFAMNMAIAQEVPIKVVFDVTSDNAAVHQSAVRHVNLMSDAYPESSFELVIYSSAYAMVDNKSSVVSEAMHEIINKENVSVVVCALTLKKNGKDMKDLVPGVGTVPDGIYEIISKQQQGWGYIKEGK
jgi:intracellular sulfur oxidation DsrE/DsrF family protein